MSVIYVVLPAIKLLQASLLEGLKQSFLINHLEGLLFTPLILMVFQQKEPLSHKIKYSDVLSVTKMPPHCEDLPALDQNETI